MKFLFKPKNAPEDLLFHVLDKIKDKDEEKKLKFIRKHMPEIQAALVQVAEQVSPSKGKQSEKKGHPCGYLGWYMRLLNQLNGTDEVIETSTLSLAASYFVEETKATAQSEFTKLLAINPAIAFKTIQRAGIFKDEILKAMETIAKGENPEFYFECYDALYSDYPVKHSADTPDSAHISWSLAYLTEIALGNMLGNGQNTVLFPLSAKKENPDAKNYLSYLRDERNMARFAIENIDKIGAVIRSVAVGASDELLCDVDNLSQAVTDKHLQSRLAGFRNIMLSERVKMCFRLAASDERHTISHPVLALKNRESPFVKIFTFSGANDSGLAFEVLCLANPVATATKDADHGIHSKYLWMLTSSDNTLAAAFSKAGLQKYLQTQAQFPAGQILHCLDALKDYKL